MMDRWRRVRFRTWTFEESGEGLVPPEAEKEGFVLAIGSSRGSEGARLFAALGRRGFGLLGKAPKNDVSLLEACPEELWKEWAGRRPPRIALPAGRRARYDILHGLGLELPLGRDATTSDELEASACAFAAYLWATSTV